MIAVIVHGAMSHDGIVALGQEVHETIIQFQRQLDFWILRKKAEQCRSEVQASEANRR